MRKVILFVLAIVICKVSSAQFQIDSTNWQQYVPNILGGNCVNISNVIYTGSNEAGGVYHYTGTNIGLSQGIVLSTGVGHNQDIAGPSNMFLNGSMNTLGDSMLTQLGSWQTYDAAVMEFDFTSPITDTLHLHYVFASEEYPEFVNSFNDIFAFWVSGPGITGSLNIAEIPGTGMAVSINNINNGNGNQGPCMNCAYYIPNDTSLSSPLAQEFGFDGLTTPLDAVFVAQGGVTYHMKIAIADAQDMVFDSAVFLEMMSNLQDFNGNITYNSAPATNGIAEVFGYNTDSTASPLIASIPLDANGNFTADSLISGSYLVRISLDTTAYPGSYPMYYTASELWTGADIITLPCFGSTIDVNPLQLPSGLGSGIIGGTLWTDTNFQKTVPIPLPNVSIFLYDSLSNVLKGYSKTASDGKFIFKNLESGTYKIVPDMPGLYVKSYRYVTISGNTQWTNLDFLAQFNGISAFGNGSTVGIENNSGLGELTLFPNPSTDVVNISFAKGTIGDVSVQIYDVSGRIINNSNLVINSEKPLVQMNVSDLLSGIYFIKISSSSGSCVKPLTIR